MTYFVIKADNIIIIIKKLEAEEHVVQTFFHVTGF